jgi:hypothetical protein
VCDSVLRHLQSPKACTPFCLILRASPKPARIRRRSEADEKADKQASRAKDSALAANLKERGAEDLWLSRRGLQAL